VIPRPSQPGQAESAPAPTKITVAMTCQAKWCAESSPVSQPAKKLGTISRLRPRQGR
jgi:hypothetical protein